MATRGTSKYKPATARRHGRPDANSTGRWRLHRPRIRRENAIVGGLAVAAIVAVFTLGGAFLLAKADRDWTSVASVNGHSISRESLRARMTVIGFLAQERYAYIGTQLMSSNLTSEQASGLQADAGAPLADTLTAARESLIDDELIRQLAAREGVATPANPDPWAEARAYVSGDMARQVRLVRFAVPPSTTSTGPTNAGPNPWPAASSTNVGAATDRLRKELADNTTVETIVAGLHDAGWVVLGEDVAVSSAGAPADASLQLDPLIATGALAGKTGDLIGPATDEYGRVSMSLLLTPSNTVAITNRMPEDAQNATVDSTALQEWANARALRRALSAALLGRQTTNGVTLAHFRELVIGDLPSAGSAGPWVELSGLALDRLALLNAAAIAGAPTGLDLHADPLARTLRDLPLTERIKLFRTLVSAANAAPAADGSKVSGEVGFATRDGLVPDVGTAAFDARVRSGDILGPVTTAAGPQLFLVEARYGGALDDRAQAALREVRLDVSPDPVAYTTRFSPTDVALARDAGWRADAEFGSDEGVRTALFDTPIGLLSDPFALDGKLAVAIVDARESGIPSARTLARLTLDGFDAWYHGEHTAARITRSDNPLPELASPTPSPTMALPTMPGLATPNLPTIPGLPAATPLKTDELGLPALP